MFPAPANSALSLFTAVGVASASFAAMAGAQYWLLVSNTGMWVAQGAAPTAVAGTAGNMYVPANFPVMIDRSLGAVVATIQDAAGGKASLTPVRL